MNTIQADTLILVCDAGYRKSRQGKVFWARIVIEVGPDTTRAYYPFDKPVPTNAVRIAVPELEWRRLMRFYKLKRVEKKTADQKREKKNQRQRRWREKKLKKQNRGLARQRVPIFIPQQVREGVISGTPTEIAAKIQHMYGITLHRSTVQYYRDKKRRYRDRRTVEWRNKPKNEDDQSST